MKFKKDQHIILKHSVANAGLGQAVWYVGPAAGSVEDWHAVMDKNGNVHMVPESAIKPNPRPLAERQYEAFCKENITIEFFDDGSVYAKRRDTLADSITIQCTTLEQVLANVILKLKVKVPEL